MARSTHPILTDLVLSAMVRISNIDDLIDVLREGLSITDEERISSYFDCGRTMYWNESDLEGRREIILDFVEI